MKITKTKKLSTFQLLQLRSTGQISKRAFQEHFKRLEAQKVYQQVKETKKHTLQEIQRWRSNSLESTPDLPDLTLPPSPESAESPILHHFSISSNSQPEAESLLITERRSLLTKHSF